MTIRKEKSLNMINSTIVVLNENDIKNFWEYAVFENDYLNNEEMPRLSNN